ncbi:phosphatase PAP2 family protein [Psychromarinibacter sp. C21-152]|uniref:Phosphatase PAP2 family protein n=1 Tax=Psychromarinibacter sediminicola TaxID=3033385 RepID=A0AAE3T813_9RHOB|nr:phosphatase PAP2 family protein [Psychromarinibacter sediminicola]MDF0600278.1 phosphatase PAP2 family protein [Psychromarinibacter sediminicola]
MRNFFCFSAAYLVVGILLVQLFRGDAAESVLIALKASAAILRNSDWRIMGVFVLALAYVFFSCGRSEWRELAIRLGFAVVGTIVFLSAFGLIKTLLTDIQPFFADRLFANLDAALHGGVDPWRITHEWAAAIPMSWAGPIYLHVWSALSALVPLALAVLDRDEARVRRYLVLYGVAWILLGNALALAGMSAGPVYYDRVLGADRFAELNAAIDGGALGNPLFRLIQEGLWELHVDGPKILGTGISAFPSVHVAVACVVALYTAERVRWLTPVAFVFVGAVLFLSVFTGYHYAIDGYVSVLVVGASWAWLRRGEMRRGEIREVAAPVAVPAE